MTEERQSERDSQLSAMFDGELPSAECELLARRLTRDELLQDVWGYKSVPLTRTVDVHIAWLRQKIEDDPKNPQYIVTVHGQGYRFSR